MKAFLDTSVLVATFYGDHEHHERSFELFMALNKRTGFVAAHSLAETYSVITGMPGKHRVSPDEALLFLDDVRERLSVVALDADAYDAAMKAAAAHSVMGGAVYDALLAYAASHTKADTLYTWNVKHFKRPITSSSPAVKTP